MNSQELILVTLSPLRYILDRKNEVPSLLYMGVGGTLQQGRMFEFRVTADRRTPANVSWGAKMIGRSGHHLVLGTVYLRGEGLNNLPLMRTALGDTACM
jgi:hypothetical protein